MRPFLNQSRCRSSSSRPARRRSGATTSSTRGRSASCRATPRRAVIYGKYIRANLKSAKIAVLYQDDDYGKELSNGLKKGLGPLASRVVSTKGYDPAASDVNSQIASLKASKANTLMIFATPKYAIQSYIQASKLGWKPKIFVNQVASASNIMKISAASSGTLANGSISIAFVKDPSNPAFAKDPTVKLYRQIMKKYAPSGDPNDVYHMYAMAVAYTFVDALKHAGNPPTRDGIMRAVTHLNETNPFLLQGDPRDDDADGSLPGQAGAAADVAQRQAGTCSASRSPRAARAAPSAP